MGGSEKVTGIGLGLSAGSSMSSPSTCHDKEDPKTAWWLCFFLFFASGVAWVVSIPVLMVTLGGSMQPHVGWIGGITTAICMFAVLVQVDQRIAATVVLLASFSSALLARGVLPFIFAVMATGMTCLNAVKQTCGPCPRFLAFQYRGYRGYHKNSELRGALDTVRPGKSFFACHPHGVTSVGWISNVVFGQRFHKVAGRCFYLIDATLRNKGLLARVFCDAFEGPHGGLRDNSRKTIQKIMENGESICMTPGAHQEATLFTHARDRVALTQRKGFVKYCLRHGYRIHPVYTFGESTTYHTLGGLEKLRLWLNSWGIPTVAFCGLPWCPILPHRNCELLTFVGRPLDLPQIADPSPEQVDEWHGKYIEALRTLFNEHKAEAGWAQSELEVV